jgi:hypothetical protein
MRWRVESLVYEKDENQRDYCVLLVIKVYLPVGISQRETLIRITHLDSYSSLLREQEYRWIKEGSSFRTYTRSRQPTMTLFRPHR